MKKTNLVFCILITVFACCGILTMVLPYFRIDVADAEEAFQKQFKKNINFEIIVDEEDKSSETTPSTEEETDEVLDVVNELADTDTDKDDKKDDSDEVLLKSRTGIQLVSQVAGWDKDEIGNNVRSLKVLIIGCLIASWLFSTAIVAVIWLVKNKAKYLISMILSLMSFLSGVILYVTVPSVAKHAIVEAIEKKLFNDYGVYDQLLDDYVKSAIIEKIGNICRDLLQSSAKMGFWMLLIVMFVCFALSMVGLILRLGGKESRIAYLLGISGQYEGAEIEIGDGIILGRDPKICQLVMDYEKISRKHCRIFYNDDTGKFTVTDFSRNGTFITGGKRIDENVPIQLDQGENVRLGENGDMFRLCVK